MNERPSDKVQLARVPVRKRRSSRLDTGPMEVYGSTAPAGLSADVSATHPHPALSSPARGKEDEAAGAHSQTAARNRPDSFHGDSFHGDVHRQDGSHASRPVGDRGGAGSQQSALQRLQGRRVLLVDAQDELRRLLYRMLSDRGFEVQQAARGSEAFECLERSLPDIVFLDTSLPEIHGIEVCRRIKSNPAYAHIPVVVLGSARKGWRFAEDLKATYSVEAFLEKPFKVSTVLATLERVLLRQPVEEDLEEVLSDASQKSLTRSVEAYQQGDLDGAIITLHHAIDADPFSFKLHYQLGLLYGRRANVMEAIDSLETAAELRPHNFSALKNLAVLYQRAGFRLMAIEVWERALVHAPDDETRQSIRGHLLGLL